MGVDALTEQKTENYEIGEVVSNRVQSPGSIKRLTASLLVSMRTDEEGGALPREPAELQELRQIVINALGIQLKEGEIAQDLVTVNEMVFAADPSALQTESMNQGFDLNKWIEIGKILVGLVLGLGVIIFFIQMLKKTKPEEISIEVLQPDQVLQNRKLEENGTVTPEMLNELIRQKPANIGVSLREWIAEPESR